MNPLYPLVAERAIHRCEYCRAPEAAFNALFEVEHIMPQAAGGADTLENLALACRSCNGFKSDRLLGTDPQTRTTVPLYHPRRDHWTEHFVIEAATLMIVGQTPQGRATVASLQMNSAPQLQARHQWRRIDLFP
jgi:hypothetical protein